MNSTKRQKDRTLKDELPRSVGAQYTTEDQWRNNSRKNSLMDSVGEGEGGKIWENGMETCKISCMK